MILQRTGFVVVVLGIVPIASAGCGSNNKPAAGQGKLESPSTNKTAPVKDNNPAPTDKKSITEPKTLTPRAVIQTGLKDICKVAVTPDGKYAAVSPDVGSGTRKTLQIWDLQTKKKIVEHEIESNLLALSPDGKSVVSKNSRFSICVVNPTTGKEEEVSLSGSNAQVSPQCDIVAVSAEGRDAKMELVPVVEIVNIAKKSSIREWPLQSKRHEGVSLTVLWEGDKKVVSGHQDGSIRIWDFATGKLIQTLSGAHQKAPGLLRSMSVAISPDGMRLASCGYVTESKQQIKIWDLQTSKLVKTLDKETMDMWFLPGGKTLVSLVYRDVHVENLETGARHLLPAEVNSCFREPRGGRPLALTPDGKVLVTGSADGTVKVWDIQEP